MTGKTSVTVRPEQRDVLTRVQLAESAREGRRLTLADIIDRLLTSWLAAHPADRNREAG